MPNEVQKCDDPIDLLRKVLACHMARTLRGVVTTQIPNWLIEKIRKSVIEADISRGLSSTQTTIRKIGVPSRQEMYKILKDRSVELQNLPTND